MAAKGEAGGRGLMPEGIMAKHKRLGIDTDVWALINPQGDVRGGDFRPHIYWGKPMAKVAQQQFPECALVRVRIVQVENGK